MFGCIYSSMEIELMHSFTDVYLVKHPIQINSASVLMCLIVLSLYMHKIVCKIIIIIINLFCESSCF